MKRAYPISSVSTSHYTTAIAAGDVETETFPGLRGDGGGCINTVQIKSKDALDWQVEVYDKNGHLLSATRLPNSDATNYGGYHYYSLTDESIPVPLTVPYDTVTVGVRNLSGTAKTAGAGGELVVTLVVMR